ncbi:LppA family lipoprotein [Solihabitans fulvus]|nr:LppA family lipoprotein [Solihabitans fulvus]
MALLASCGSPQSAPAKDTTRQEASVNTKVAELMQRPDIEHAATAYEEMGAKVRERLTTELGRTWEQRDKAGASLCGSDYPDLNADGEVRGLALWSSPGNLPDAQWDRAVAIVGEIASGYGFTAAPEVVANRPSEHDVVFHKPDDAKINFSTGRNTSLMVTTGCHLTAKAHQRVTSTTPTT